MHNLIFSYRSYRIRLRSPICGLMKHNFFHALEPNPGLFIAESPKVIERALREQVIGQRLF